MLFEKQQYQEDCVENIITALSADGVDVMNNDYSKLDKSVSSIYEKNKIYSQFKTIKKNKLDILMETGTGKTFTYIKTIFEVNKEFKKNKFIIVVPRNAIRLGIMQNIKLTKEYFFNEYGKHLNVIEYPKDGLGKIENDFLVNDKLTVLVLTNSAFNSDKNLINQLPENGLLHINGTIWENISKQHPVVIIDEPHLLKGKQTAESFNALDGLFIRFGATYPVATKKEDPSINLSNVAYSLDSISSFNQYLVKKIRVNTVFAQSEQDGYVLSAINTKKKTFTISYFENNENKQKEIQLKSDIGAITGISKFYGVRALKLNASSVTLSNGHIETLDTVKSLTDEEQRLMIRQTIKKHFEKEERLFNQGIKTLSLFFIQNVADFRSEINPVVKKIFEEEYLEQREVIYNSTKNKDYKTYLDKDFSKDGKLSIHEGYFSGDKGTKDDKESTGINKILNKKEDLLSLQEPLRFIFSVWALQEGWDNPNVFNICKLSNTDKDTSRRQQVGRGLRLAVNQQGRRLTYKYLNEDEKSFYDINTLDMVVSHHELDFINKIQQEIVDSSYCIAGNTISDAILQEKGLNPNESMMLLATLASNNIIEFNNESNEFEIKTSIYDFLQENREKVSFIDDARLVTIKELFKEPKTIVENGNKQKPKVKIRQEKLEEFKELWETINRKSKLVYKNLNEEQIIQNVADKFNLEKIDPIEIKVVEKEYDSQKNQIFTKHAENLGGNVEFFKTRGFNDFIQMFVQDEKLKLPLTFAVKVLNKLDKELINNNPKKAKAKLKDILLSEIHSSVIKDVEYSLEGNTQITSLHDKDSKQYLTEIEYTQLGRKISDKQPADNLLYDTVVYDSVIEEKAQTGEEDAEVVNGDKITVFAKLPKVSIPTPFKTYNPDFAYLVNKQDGKKLFLVVETKGYDSEAKIPPEEQQKIDYAKEFFKKLQQELPNIQVEFKTRVNKKQLSEILKEIEEGTK